MPANPIPSALDASTDAAGFAQAVVAACLDQILPNAGAIAQGSVEVEQIHQLRVGLRRLRTAISELAELNSGIDPGWEAPLATVFRALGASRDRELMNSASLRDELLAAGGPGLACIGPCNKGARGAVGAGR